MANSGVIEIVFLQCEKRSTLRYLTISMNLVVFLPYPFLVRHMALYLLSYAEMAISSLLILDRTPSPTLCSAITEEYIRCDRNHNNCY